MLTKTDIYFFYGKHKNNMFWNVENGYFFKKNQTVQKLSQIWKFLPVSHAQTSNCFLALEYFKEQFESLENVRTYISLDPGHGYE